MLLLSFDISGDQYVIDTQYIIEVVTLVPLKALPGSITGVCGLLNYHGNAVPVIDINALCNGSEQPHLLTTRLIIINYKSSNIIGIKAENVTETLRIEKSEFKHSGIDLDNNPFLSDVAEYNNKFIQLIDINKLLSDDMFQCLFSDKSMALG